jgi:hypothetical protein
MKELVKYENSNYLIINKCVIKHRVLLRVQLERTARKIINPVINQMNTVNAVQEKKNV